MQKTGLCNMPATYVYMVFSLPAVFQVFDKFDVCNVVDGFTISQGKRVLSLLRKCDIYKEEIFCVLILKFKSIK